MEAPESEIYNLSGNSDTHGLENKYTVRGKNVHRFSIEKFFLLLGILILGLFSVNIKKRLINSFLNNCMSLHEYFKLHPYEALRNSIFHTYSLSTNLVLS